MAQRSTPLEEVRLSLVGFSLVLDGKVEFTIEWDKIIGIAAFKRDLFIIDEICLAFRTADLGYPFVGEQATGYKELAAEIEHRFPDHNPEWWHHVAFPPHETCWTVVWGEAPQPIDCPSCGYDLRGTPDLQCPECGTRLPQDVCPECSGRGEFRSLALLRWGAYPLAAGLVLLGITYLVEPRSGLLIRALGSLIFLLIGVGGVCAVVNLTAICTTCPCCKGTGRQAEAGNPPPT